MMHTEQSLIADLQALGILPGDVITAHMSLKSVGTIDTSEKTGAEVVISALKRCVPQGLLAIPSHTYTNLVQEPVFNIRTSEPCIGAVPRVAARMASEAWDQKDRSCIRSSHPSHSVVAFGKEAYAFVKDDRLAETAFPPFGCYGKLLQMSGKILLIGVGLERNSFIHLVDEAFYDDYIAAGRLTPVDKFSVTVIDYDGTARACQMRTTHQPAPSRCYPQYQPLLEQAGALRYGKFGDADVIVCDARKAYDAIFQAVRDGFILQK